MSRRTARCVALVSAAALLATLASCGFLSVGDDQKQQAGTACKQAVIPLVGGADGAGSALPRSLELTKDGDGWTGRGSVSVGSAADGAPIVRTYSCTVTTVNGVLVARITDLSR